MLRTLIVLVAAAAVLATAAGASGPSLLKPASLHDKAPAQYTVAFQTTKGPFRVHVTRAWAPKGADRFYNLVKYKYYNGVRLFRVLPGFVVQFGIHPTPKIAKTWFNANIADDPVKKSNTKWSMTFADAGPNTRSTQVFINLGNNSSLDSQGFAPFGLVTFGRKNVNKFYSRYGEAVSSQQQAMVTQGDGFIRKHFPKLDRIISGRIVR
jgi:peptidyl-prolyl cis-trans isomerase A (cyclophilin A)